MSHTGGCRCGTIRYSLSAAPRSVSLCHCRDCQRSAGAPMVAWAMFAEGAFTLLQGEPKTVNSSGTAMRSFCPECGTGLFYRNAVILPGLVDVQTATLDDPAALPPGGEIQTAERLAWMQPHAGLPQFPRFPTAAATQIEK